MTGIVQVLLKMYTCENMKLKDAMICSGHEIYPKTENYLNMRFVQFAHFSKSKIESESRFKMRMSIFL